MIRGNRTSVITMARKVAKVVLPMDVNTFISVDCEIAGVNMKKSLIRHRMPGLGIFPARPYEPGMIVHYYIVLWYMQTLAFDGTPHWHTGSGS